LTPVKTLAILAYWMVGGVGFECARGTQALKGIALPAYGKYQHQAGRDLDSS